MEEDGAQSSMEHRGARSVECGGANIVIDAGD